MNDASRRQTRVVYFAVNNFCDPRAVRHPWWQNSYSDRAYCGHVHFSARAALRCAISLNQSRAGWGVVRRGLVIHCHRWVWMPDECLPENNFMGRAQQFRDTAGDEKK